MSCGSTAPPLSPPHPTHLVLDFAEVNAHPRILLAALAALAAPATRLAHVGSLPAGAFPWLLVVLARSMAAAAAAAAAAMYWPGTPRPPIEGAGLSGGSSGSTVSFWSAAGVAGSVWASLSHCTTRMGGCCGCRQCQANGELMPIYMHAGLASGLDTAAATQAVAGRTFLRSPWSPACILLLQKF